MAELTFTLNPETGELTCHIAGIAGPACEEVAKLARDLLGEPSQEQETAEYRLRSTVQPRARVGAQHQGQQ